MSSILSGWVTDARQENALGTMVAGRYFVRAHLHVTEAFNSDGSDLLTVGYAADPDAFITSTDVSSTGVKTVTLGTLAGYNATARPVVIYYSAGGSAPTQGRALVVLEFFATKLAPS